MVLQRSVPQSYPSCWVGHSRRYHQWRTCYGYETEETICEIIKRLYLQSPSQLSVFIDSASIEAAVPDHWTFSASPSWSLTNAWTSECINTLLYLFHMINEKEDRREWSCGLRPIEAENLVVWYMIFEIRCEPLGVITVALQGGNKLWGWRIYQRRGDFWQDLSVSGLGTPTMRGSEEDQSCSMLTNDCILCINLRHQ